MGLGTCPLKKPPHETRGEALLLEAQQEMAFFPAQVTSLVLEVAAQALFGVVSKARVDAFYG